MIISVIEIIMIDGNYYEDHDNCDDDTVHLPV